MEFALSDDQRMLQDSLTGFLGANAPLETIRKIAAGDGAAQADLARGLAAFGLAGLHVPERAGGSGLGLLEACLVQEAIGYAVAPSGFAAATVAAIALASDEAWLGAIASGEAQIGLAIGELAARRAGAGVAVAGEELTGRSLLAVSAQGASHVLVGVALKDFALVRSEDVTLRPMQTIDRTRTFHELVLTSAKPVLRVTPAADVLAATRLLAAADTLGAAQAMLDKAVAYAGERQQFGRVIGSFQAVKHMCAEMAAKLEPARALVWHAAYALDTQDGEGPLMATLAAAHLGEVGTFVARTATEVHGGMGFTDLVGLHYWFKRIGVNRQLFGSPEQARETAAALQGFA